MIKLMFYRSWYNTYFESIKFMRTTESCHSTPQSPLPFDFSYPRHLIVFSTFTTPMAIVALYTVNIRAP